MPDKKPTDSEIIKKFQLCTLKAEHPGFVLCGQIVGLINRLQAENERLFLENQKFLSVMLWGNKKNKKNFLKQIKTKAYKECIEKAKSELENISKFDFHGTYYYLVGEAFFDNLLKELVGDGNG
jgi:hypothetical protein